MPRLLSLCSATLVLIFGHVCSATVQQTEPERVQGRIVGRIWHTRVRFEDGFKFLNKVREELEIEQSPVLMLAGPAAAGIGSQIRFNGTPNSSKPDEPGKVEMNGTLFFLQTHPEVSLNNQISFELVGTPEEFKARVDEHVRTTFGAELIGSEDKYEVRLDLSKLMQQVAEVDDATKNATLQDGKTPADSPRTVRTFAITISSELGTEDKPNTESSSIPEMPNSISTFYRYVDGIMYSTQTSAVHHIELPGQADLKISDDEAANDLFADFNLTEIPAELKRTFWTALEAQAGVFLQRFDNEAFGDYSLRRAIAEGRLEVLRAVLFDIDRAQFYLKLPEDDQQPISARLKVTARSNSVLAGSLEGIGSRRSQLSVLQDERSPFVVSSTIAIPEFLKPFSTAFVASLSAKLKEAASSNPGVDVLVDDLLVPLQNSFASGQLDSAICLRGNVETGLIPCGGTRLEDSEQFLSSLETLLQISAQRDQLQVSGSSLGDYRMVTLRANKAVIPFVGKELPVQLNIAATGSWLWMTVGGAPAVDMLEELVTNHSANVDKTGEAIPLLVRFRLDKWLGETDDPLSGIPRQILVALERWLGKATAPKMSLKFNGNNIEQKQEEPAFTSYAAKLLKPKSSDLELKVRTAGEEILIDATVGMGLTKFAVAQFLDSQSRMFKGLDFGFTPAPGQPGVKTIRIGVGGKPPK